MANFIKPYTETKERSDKYAQEYDRKKIFLTKAGQTYNLYDYIQEQREDTEIYPTLEKYGNIDVLNKTGEEVFADVSNALELRDLYNQEIQLKEIFENLPIEEKREFNMNYLEFRQRGLEFYNKKAQSEIEFAQKQRQENENKPVKVEITNTAKETNNDQK